MKLKELFEVLGARVDVVLNIDLPDSNCFNRVSGVASILKAVLNDSTMDAAVANICTRDDAICVDVEVDKNEES